ncbi:RNA-binding protein with multiple splicing [Nymphaea thermarum]|nr:RNA-binding protein with multiple splicing [Nymphaea thermarum]
MDAMASGYGGTTTTANIQNPHYPYLPQPQTALHHLHHHPQHHHLLLHQPQPQAQPPPPPAAAAMPGVHAAYQPSFPPMQGYADELRTLFIAGLPGDVKPREIFNLFRDLHGFQTYQIKHSGQSSQAFAFAVFSDQQSAISAMHALNGMEFDLDKGSTLHIDLARSNSRTKRLRTDSGGPPMDKRVKGAAAISRSSEPGIGGINAGLDTSGHNIMNGYPSAQSLGGDNQSAVGLKSSIPSAVPDAPADNPPCPTLFVANLGPACTEDELTQLFMRFPGFLKLKIQRKSGLPVAFVDFQDTACSSQAMSLQGTVLYSSDGEGIRLEYAKSRMGLPKRQRM